MKNMINMFKQAREMQSNMKRLQKELQNQEFDLLVGGVKVVMRGDEVLKSITIEPEMMQKDVRKLEEAIVVAINKTREKVKENLMKKMQSMTGGLDLPGLLGQ